MRRVATTGNRDGAQASSPLEPTESSPGSSSSLPARAASPSSSAATCRCTAVRVVPSGGFRWPLPRRRREGAPGEGRGLPLGVFVFFKDPIGRRPADFRVARVPYGAFSTLDGVSVAASSGSIVVNRITDLGRTHWSDLLVGNLSVGRDVHAARWRGSDLRARTSPSGSRSRPPARRRASPAGSATAARPRPPLRKAPSVAP